MPRRWLRAWAPQHGSDNPCLGGGNEKWTLLIAYASILAKLVYLE